MWSKLYVSFSLAAVPGYLTSQIFFTLFQERASCGRIIQFLRRLKKDRVARDVEEQDQDGGESGEEETIPEDAVEKTGLFPYLCSGLIHEREGGALSPQLFYSHNQSLCACVCSWAGRVD